MLIAFHAQVNHSRKLSVPPVHTVWTHVKIDGKVIMAHWTVSWVCKRIVCTETVKIFGFRLTFRNFLCRKLLKWTFCQRQ